MSKKCYCEVKRHLWNAKHELQAARREMPDCEKWHGATVRKILKHVVDVMTVHDTVSRRGGFGVCDCDYDEVYSGRLEND